MELRFEDPNTGELFALSPVPPEKKDAFVEAVTDSSRYFVVRVEDPSTGRHAFLGMGFSERGDAFDFNVALSDHVRHCQRESEIQRVKGGGQDSSAQLTSEDAKVLYQPHRDLSLKQGQTIHVSLPNRGAPGKPPASSQRPGSGPAPLIPPPPGLQPPPPAAPAPSAPADWTAFSGEGAAASSDGWARFD